MNGQFHSALEKIQSGEQTIHIMPVYKFNFQLGRLNLLLGSPGAGKSLMTMHVMLQAVKEHRRILLLSSEMTIYQYLVRILKHELGINGRDEEVAKRINSPLAKDIVAKLITEIETYVDYQSVFKINFAELFTDETLPDRYDLICLDYIQNTPLKGSVDDYNRLTSIVNYIKAFTLTGLDKTGVICSQVAKSQFNEKGKVDSDIILLPKGSNAIYESSDYAVQLLRDPDTLLVYVSNTKNKDLPTDPKRVYKINADLRFSEIKV